MYRLRLAFAGLVVVVVVIATARFAIADGVGGAGSAVPVPITVAGGGTNSTTALTGSGAVVVENGTAIVQGPAGTATTVLHGAAAGLPTYGAVALSTDVTGVLPVANGGTGSATAASGEHDFSAYNAANVAAATALSETTVTRASTATADSKITTDVAGVGAGNFVMMLCTDGTTCAAGNQRLTCTQACTAAAGTRTACTVQNAGTIAAATVVTWSVTTACATTDPGMNVNAHMTTP
jgi:hypothetical protein